MACDFMGPRRLKRWLGLGLVALSFCFYGGLLLVPLAPFNASGKIALSTALVVCGEASFWIAVLILGKEVLSKYRADPRKWLRRKI